MQTSKPNTGEVVEEETTPLIAECRKDLEKQSTGSQNTLRSYLWQLAVVFVFVALGSCQALSTKLSETRNGKLPYDSSAAVAIAEAVKLMVSLVCVFFVERDQLSGITASTLRYEFGELSVIAFLFALQNELNFLVIEQLGSALFVMLGNLKIVFTCIFMRLIMGKQFAPLQWFAVCTLFVSAAIVKLPLVMFGASGVEDGTAKKSFLFGIMMLLVACTSSGLSSVQNEIVLKRRGAGGQSLSFMAKNAVLYSWGVLFNALSWMMFGQKPFLACFTQMGLASILCLAGMGLACAVILGYLDNVVRCFSSVAQVLVVVLFSRLFPDAFQEGEIDFFFMAAMTLLVVAIVTYQNHDSPNLWTYVYSAAVGSVAMGYMAMTLDSAPHFAFLSKSMH
jgi:hypothetical protein